MKPRTYDETQWAGSWSVPRMPIGVSPPDANWEAPYSARFHFGASAPGD